MLCFSTCFKQEVQGGFHTKLFGLHHHVALSEYAIIFRKHGHSFSVCLFLSAPYFLKIHFLMFWRCKGTLIDFFFNHFFSLIKKFPVVFILLLCSFYPKRPYFMFIWSTVLQAWFYISEGLSTRGGAQMTVTDSLYSSKLLFSDKETVNKTGIVLVPNEHFLCVSILSQWYRRDLRSYGANCAANAAQRSGNSAV